ncbi:MULTISPECIES: hypothetical protein [unclassified Clostridium]|uniref:hypothetical protein n=1 Tax=unclassified Clostridium TaxID=2614128 RepID=UPI000298085A|nr:MULTISPECIES: hypothetical protein [unclassified Clostridium]EKQ57712.1 MAG: hypothetical protein A370_00599 [Clostridium sp. Maddingley MBC34-26]
MKIEGFFSGIKAANETVEALKKVGINDAVVDIKEEDAGISDPGNRGAGINPINLSDLVLTNDPHDAGPLAAASPMVSGYGRFDEIADVNYRVIVNTDDNNAEKAKQIINKMGGDLRDLNFKMPKGLENISLDDLMSIMINDVNSTRD